MSERNDASARTGRLFFLVALFYLAVLVGWLLLRPALRQGDALDVADTQTRQGPNRTGQVTTAEKVGDEDIAASISQPLDPPDAAPMTDFELKILELTNERRVEHALSVLMPELRLAEIARGHSDDMLARQFFAHTNPEGLGPADRVAVQHRRLVGLASENLFKVWGEFSTDADDLALEIVTGWMNSPGHRANILRPESTHLGVGVSQTSDQIYATQVFTSAWAYFDEDIPVAVGTGQPLEVAGNVAPGLVAVSRAYLYDGTDNVAQAAFDKPGTTFSGSLHFNAPTGDYQLELGFLKGTSGYIVHGPRVAIQ